MQKLSLKPVLERDQSVKEFGYVLNLIFETYFRRSPQHWGFCSKHSDQSDVLGQRIGADWCYYISYMRAQILERECQALRQSSQPICPVHYLTRFDHKIVIPGWKENESVVVHNDRMGGEESDLSQIAENSNVDASQASNDDAYSEVPVTGGNQASKNVDGTAIISEFLLDVGLFELNLSEGLSEMRGYLRGRLGLKMT